MAERVLVGDVHHLKLVPDGGGNMLNKEVTIHPEWAILEQRSAVCIITKGTSMECWGKIFLGSLGGRRGGTNM